ncbi:alpha-1,2-fucosyltransferase [uncultured Tenacibaculum sp.]|uniref:alpha-1,2-fucosyltransferase n=1 Tax=uncultured Tenacibaculum sp. TaxID=174713 RepID=UPI00262A13AA|nr:alpha-1,2-fucosyltransferase [uncultured Tenacibaculum sp.]
MVIIRIVGGLGNQMFQYAYAKALQLSGYDVKIDITKFKKYKLHGGYQLDKYKIDLDSASSFAINLGKLGLKKSLKEKSLLFNQDFKSIKGNEYVKGYFQTEKYFSEIRDTLLEQFTINIDLATSTKDYSKQIKEAKISCSLHIRRGDYISDQKANSVHGTCSLEYYKEAIELLNKKYGEVKFFIFSDDIEWVKSNLPVENAVYVDHKTIPHEDIYLMSLCNHNITANSTFSWWGAWLNKNENKTVIAPKQWYIDKENEIVPQNWVRI